MKSVSIGICLLILSIVLPSFAADKPLIYPRKEAKAHGLGKLIEGAWQPGERVTIIEDLITAAKRFFQLLADIFLALRDEYFPNGFQS